MTLTEHEQKARELVRELTAAGISFAAFHHSTGVRKLSGEIVADVTTRIAIALQDVHDAAIRAEREACKRDVCTYCGGRGPTHTAAVVGPNQAGNYVHMPTKDYAKNGGGRRLCDATSIFARERWAAITAED